MALQNAGERAFLKFEIQFLVEEESYSFDTKANESADDRWKRFRLSGESSEVVWSDDLGSALREMY